MLFLYWFIINVSVYAAQIAIFQNPQLNSFGVFILIPSHKSTGIIFWFDELENRIKAGDKEI